MSSSALDTVERPDAIRHRGRGPVIALALAGVGAGLLTVSFTEAAWLKYPIQLPLPGSPPATAQITFANIHHPRYGFSVHPTLMTAYFSWLAWALLIVSVTGVLLSYGPLRHVLAVRVSVLVAALAGLGVTVKVIRELQLVMVRRDWRTFVHELSTGPWFAIAGFALISLAALRLLAGRDSVRRIGT